MLVCLFQSPLNLQSLKQSMEVATTAAVVDGAKKPPPPASVAERAHMSRLICQLALAFQLSDTLVIQSSKETDREQREFQVRIHTAFQTKIIDPLRLALKEYARKVSQQASKHQFD